MRLIGQLKDPDAARRFADYLYTLSIDNDIEENADGAWGVWVHDENQLEEAGKLLTVFQEDPNADKYSAATKQAVRLRKEAEAEEKAAAKRMKGPQDLWSRSSFGTLTMLLIVSSVIVSLLADFGHNNAVANVFKISGYRIIGTMDLGLHGLPEIKSGQVWRLITPILLHGGWLHLIFNCMWIRDLGGMIERAGGTRKLLLFVLVIAVPSNLAQYAISGPGFCGLSGVVYGLLGYIWMKSRYDFNSGLYLHPTTVTFMLAWYVVCLFGFMPIANTVHTVGLVIGVVWGFAGAKLRPS